MNCPASSSERTKGENERMKECDTPPLKKVKMYTFLGKDLKDSLLHSINFLETSPIASLAMLKIKKCDADFSTCFSKATCYVEECVGMSPPHEVYSFASVFQYGVSVLETYLTDHYSLPKEKGARLAIERLFTCLEMIEKNGGKIGEENVGAFVKAKKETSWTIQLAHHLLKELAVSQAYTIAICSKFRARCCWCCSEKITGAFDDTSIGNDRVWHGAMDILMGQTVALKVEEDKDDDPNKNSTNLIDIKDDNRLKRDKHQIIAETIVFACLQKQVHPSRENFLIPTIAVSKEDIVVYFYDPENDILLESGQIQLFDRSTNVSLYAVIALWLAINYEYLCTGIIESMKESGNTADFFNKIDKKAQEVYKNQLQYGSCGYQSAEGSKNFRSCFDCVVKTSEPLKRYRPSEI